MKKILLYLIGCMVVTGGAWAALQDGLVGYWPFDGDFVDATGNGHNGVSQGTVVLFEPGKLDQAAVFDGLNGPTPGIRVDGNTGWNPSEGTGLLSLSFWIKWGGSSGGYQGVVAKRDSWGVNTMMWATEINMDSSIISFFTNGSYPWGGGIIPATGQWEHFAVSFDGTTQRFYHNGAETGSGGFAFGGGTAARVVIGCSDAWNAFKGSIDDVAIWNRVLSAQDVTDLYNGGDGLSLSGEKWQAVNVAPADKATEIPMTGAKLQWAASPDPAPGPIVRYDVFLDTDFKLVSDVADPNKEARVAQLAPTVFEYNIPGTLTDDTTYYWRIDTVVDDVNIAFGRVSRFQTLVMTPIITGQPQDVVVGPGGWPVSFTVVATTNDGDISYKWFKQGNATVLSTTDTLNLNATAGALGQYYCELTNAYTTSPVVSNTAELSIGTGSWAAINPDPDGSVWVDPQVDLPLKWQHAPFAPYNADYQVYFGEFGEALTLKGTTKNFQFVLPEANLAYDKKYSWRVDTTDGLTTESGPVWSFETIKLKPIAMTNPVNAVVPDEGTATFSFGVDSPTEVTYIWYKQESGLQVGTGNPLVLANVGPASEGYYYCDATNPSGTTRSAAASLMLEQLLAHWKMDETVLAGDTGALIKDSTAFMHDGTESGEVHSIDGKLGNAMAFDGTNDYVDTGTWNPNERSTQFTITLWANWAGLNGKYQGLIAKRNNWGADMMWQLEANIDTGALGFAREGSYPPGVGALPIGQWAFVAVAFDGTNVTLYRDGLAAASGAFSLGGKLDANLIIGGSDVNSGNFNGQLDDVRIYNYALDALEVAHLYTDVAQVSVCMGNPAHDFDGNCRLGLNDVALFAAEWLKCNLAPQSACQ